jgi:hypothetical protein
LVGLIDESLANFIDRKPKNVQILQQRHCQPHQKFSAIAHPNASIEKLAVMVKLLDAAVANSTVVCQRWSIHFASFTVSLLVDASVGEQWLYLVL